ncbi:MAG: type II CRISPR-associated endonuclease Cas1 [Candidatus Cloacimonetes bacterium]|nr:type II CRISPR-associated endonuclease Cas1 [Candidatus Cloacimonadota bacterium]
MQILEIDKQNIRISVSKGFVTVEDKAEQHRHPLDNIGCIIVNSYGAQFSNQTLIRLAEANIPLLICGNNAMPIGMLLSTSQNVYRKQRIETQIKASVPLRKQLWQSIVKAKISNQSNVLKKLKKEYKDMVLLATNVRSGDADNSEAVAARRYWNRLFEESFKRDPELPGINAFLNYGYAIIRAAICRAIVGTGLLPELGVNHRNMMNPFCLADDIMEPFRPFIDIKVHALATQNHDALTPAIKKELISILKTQINFQGKRVHLDQSMLTIVYQFIESLNQKKPLLQFPILE